MWAKLQLTKILIYNYKTSWHFFHNDKKGKKEKEKDKRHISDSRSFGSCFTKYMYHHLFNILREMQVTCICFGRGYIYGKRHSSFFFVTLED